MSKNGIVMVTGGSGFIGQHIIKHLIQEKDKLDIKEIRSIDLIPYTNQIGHKECKELITYIGDICQPETIENAFIDVDTVFHCAAYISFQYPPNYEELGNVNIDGTRKIVELCLKLNIKRLIYTSCASVNFVPYMGSTFSIVINQTESKASTPVYDTQQSSIDYDKGFFIPGYSSSKLRAEKIVLSSSGASLNNGIEYLQTCALRPPLTYGEGDNHFMPKVFKYLSKHKNNIPRLGGAGGKQQLVYAGNVAWGHICAYKTLKTSPKSINGLPIFITDDTPVNDISRFIQRIGNEMGTMKFHTTWWSIPHFVFFFIGFLIEMFIKLLHSIFPQIHINYSLRALSAFTASVVLYNRLRASIHIDYVPLYDEKETFRLSANWYNQWFNQNIGLPSASASSSKKHLTTSDDKDHQK